MKASIVLFSDGLLSKWGFYDGDAPDHWLDWCDEHGIDYLLLPSWRNQILPTLIRRYLLPRIEQDVKVIKIGTNHNPIRAETVDGVDVTDCWYDSRKIGPALTPDSVEIPMERVLQIAQESIAFPEERPPQSAGPSSGTT